MQRTPPKRIELRNKSFWRYGRHRVFSAKERAAAVESVFHKREHLFRKLWQCWEAISRHFIRFQPSYVGTTPGAT